MSDDNVEPRNLALQIAVVVYVVIVAGLVGGYIWVATMEIDVSAYVQGPTTLQQGQNHALRGFYLNAPTGRTFTSVEVDITTDDGQSLGDGKTGPHGYFQVQINPSELEVGPRTLNVRAKHPTFETYDVQAPVTVVASPASELAGLRPPKDADPIAQTLWLQEYLDNLERSNPLVWPKLTTRLADEKADWKKDKPFEGELQVDAFPSHGELIRGLPNTVYLRVTRKSDGAPIRARVIMQKVEGQSEDVLPRELVTDELGFARVEFSPIGAHRWTLRAESMEPRKEDTEIKAPEIGEGKVSWASVPAQFSMQMTKNWVVPGDVAKAMVHTLYRSGGFMVDLYDSDRWVTAEAFGISNKGGGLVVKVPEVARSPVLRVQIYESVFAPGVAWDSRYVAVVDSPDTDGCWRGLKRVLRLVGTQAPHKQWAENALGMMTNKRTGNAAQCNQWLEAALLALPAHFEPAPLLVNSQQAERESLEAWKDGVQYWLMLMTIIALLVGFAGLLLLVDLGVKAKRRQRDAFLAVDAELEGEDFVETRAGRLERIGTIARAVILVGTVALFGIGVVLVLSLL